MYYKNGYLAIFTEITQLLTLLEQGEGVNVPHYLQRIQQLGEEACIAKTPKGRHIINDETV